MTDWRVSTNRWFIGRDGRILCMDGSEKPHAEDAHGRYQTFHRLVDIFCDELEESL
jgi:hypothetical protein